MNCKARLLTALAACFLLASCAASAPPATGPQQQPPTESSTPCPQPPEAPPMTGEVDPVALALVQMYDLYAICAGRTVERIKWDESEALR